eukprot:UN13267
MRLLELDRGDMNRSALIGQGPLDGFSRDPWGTRESDDISDLSVGDIRQQQQHVIREQDQGLDVLT